MYTSWHCYNHVNRIINLKAKVKFIRELNEIGRLIIEIDKIYG